MRALAATAALSLVLLTFAAGGAGGQEGNAPSDQPPKDQPFKVLLPLNFTKTFRESVFVVGRARPGSPVFLTLNGGSRQGVKWMPELFFARTPLFLGSNYIEVHAQDDRGNRISQGVVLFREPKIGMGSESPLPPYRYHTEKNETLCGKCHDLNPPEEGGREFATATKFCLGCHKELISQRVIHRPIPIGGCIPCHRFSSTPNRYEVLAQGQELCFQCHEEKRKYLVRAYLHGPMSAGLCTVCHDPHGSSEKHQLRRYAGDLCMTCHEGVKAAAKEKVVHKPLGDGPCTVCHEPHSSARNDGFLKLPANDLCLSCHSGILRMAHTHPYDGRPKVERPIKLDSKGRLLCISCHEAHASEEPKLLVKGGCGACHPT